MIGTLPATELAPLDYRYALDAAMATLGSDAVPLVVCNAPELVDEIRQRLPYLSESGRASAALWVEPLAGIWPTELRGFAEALGAGAPLVVVASRPLARLLPERHGWTGRALGLRPGGIGRLTRGLRRCGFALDASYGVHSAPAIGLNLLSRQLDRWGHPDLGDRLHFAARLRYCTSGPLAMLSTVALLIARKERA